MLLFLALACTGKLTDRVGPDDTSAENGGDTGGETATETGTDSGGETGDTGETSDSNDTTDSGETADSQETAGTVDPPLGETSGGGGGVDAPTGTDITSGAARYTLIAPTGSATGHAVPLLLVISGTEGSAAMSSNMRQVARYAQLDDALIAVLDGRTARAADTIATLDDVRAKFDVDNDRTWLLSESAGTGVGLDVGLDQRQSYFAAYWANDVNARGEPAANVATLGFSPWGNAGPGGDYDDANAIVAGMRAAGYQLPSDAPYSGPGSDTHGSTDQFLEAVSFFHDKRRD